jgi:hypothetical protein
LIHTWSGIGVFGSAGEAFGMTGMTGVCLGQGDGPLFAGQVGGAEVR